MKKKPTRKATVAKNATVDPDLDLTAIFVCLDELEKRVLALEARPVYHPYHPAWLRAPYFLEFNPPIPQEWQYIGTCSNDPPCA